MKPFGVKSTQFVCIASSQMAPKLPHSLMGDRFLPVHWMLAAISHSVLMATTTRSVVLAAAVLQWQQLGARQHLKWVR